MTESDETRLRCSCCGEDHMVYKICGDFVSRYYLENTDETWNEVRQGDFDVTVKQVVAVCSKCKTSRAADSWEFDYPIYTMKFGDFTVCTDGSEYE